MRDEFLERLKARPEPGQPKRDLPEHLCPRCGHRIPIVYGRYQTGHSRKDRSIEICSACAAHEGFQQMQGVDLSAQDWPVEVPRSFRY